MASDPPTRTSLLVRLREWSDGSAWTQFVDVYGPLVYWYMRRHDLQDADAADLTQDVLLGVAGAIRRFEYDRNKGSFRGWLSTASRNALTRFKAGQGRRPQAGDPEFTRLFEQQPERSAEGNSEPGEWDQEFERRLLEYAAEQVRGEFPESTWMAFRRTAFENASPRVVAAEIGMSVGAVYVAKSRFLARLRVVIEELQSE